MSKPVIPEGRTGTPNVAGLRRSRLSKAPDQDFVVQVATRDENALRLVPSPPAGPAQELDQAPQQAPAQAPMPAPQQVPVQAPQQPAAAPQQVPVQAPVPDAQQDPVQAPMPAPQQVPVQAPQQPAAAPQEALPPQPAPASQQPQAEAQPAPAAAPEKKPQADEPPRKKKENYLQDWDDAARVRRAFNRTKHITGIENWSEFVSSALLEKAIQLEAQYNEGQPFDGSTKAPMGRPAAAE